MTNRLGAERSSYLKGAAHQPVAWQPWGKAAFEQAEREDKPVLLDIGAVWCHWCHVMDHESYEDKATAALINERFIAVKVDRDERPDVDARYQKAIQAMTGQGGWPLTGFLLPDGRAYYGGTYFPPTDAHGRPSFRRVLEAVAEAYHERREEVLTNAAALMEHFLLTDTPDASQDEAAWDDIISRAVGRMRETFDADHGGFGRSGPKFPHPAAHDFLLERAAAGDVAARDVVLPTLDRMRASGAYDQLGGGFHRYSVDAAWRVPHFEKMLYDNAGLLRNYARAGDLETACDIKRFLRDVLRQPDGTFGGSQDADVGPDDDGDFFTWTQAEVDAAASSPQLARLVSDRYGVRPEGDMHHDKAKCVLRVEADARTLAAASKLPLDETTALLARGKHEMQEARAKRTAPFVDPVPYTNWNAMAIQALLEHGGLHEDAEADALALRAMQAFLAAAFDPARGWAHVAGGATFGLLDDNAQMLDALLEAHFATGDARYLDAAQATGEVLLAHFKHPLGGFADRAEALAPPAETGPLATPERPTQDAPTASANGTACRALLRLAQATGEPRYQAEAMAALRALATEAERLALFGGALLLAIEEAVHPRPRIVVRAKDEAPYRAVAREHARSGATFARPDDLGVPPEARLFLDEGAMVCVGTRCLAPARTPGELAERLDSLSR